MPTKRYYMKYTVKEAHGHRYDFEKYVDLKRSGATRRAIRGFETDYEKTQVKHGIQCKCTVTVLAKTRQQPKRTKGTPGWIKTMLGGITFWIILIALLWLASAPWMR